MAQARVDNNKVSTLIAASSADGITPVLVEGNTSNHGLSVADGTTGSDLGRTVAVRDDNGRPVFMAVSSADGITPIEIYVDPTGELLIKST